MNKNENYVDNIRPSTQTSPGLGMCEQVEDTSHVARGVAGPHPAVYINFPPPYMKYCRDRGKPRSLSELKSVFVMGHDDYNSVDIPGIMKYLCGYLIGLETVRQQLAYKDVSSYDSMDTGVSKTGHRKISTDYVSDAELIWFGLTYDGYQERLKQATDIGAALGWQETYKQLVEQCFEEEKMFAEIIKQLRDHPDRDSGHICEAKCKKDITHMMQKWKILTAIETQLSNNIERMKSDPCLSGYSDIERHFGSAGYLESLKLKRDIAIPDRWTHDGETTSKWTRRLIAEVVISCEDLTETIKNHISKMEAVRKEKYITLCNRRSALDVIVGKLNKIKVNVSSGHQEADTFCTEEEIWYSESSWSYVDVYIDVTERNRSTQAASSKWEATAKENRASLSKKVFEGCRNLHQQYGELVKGLRTERESKQRGIKTHVSELEERIAEIQSKLIELTSQFEGKEKRWFEKDIKTQLTNAELTEKLDRANGYIEQLVTQEDLRWRQNIETMNLEHQRQIQQLKAQLADTRNGMRDLKIEKENLLTRLSKIAGSKLVHGNPAITDLSDANRPTKVSEKYSELYDNEWTDALEELTDTIGMEQELFCTKTLLAILIEAFTFCCETEAGYVKTITRSITSLPGPDPDQKQNDTTDATTLPQEQQQQFDELRKACIPMLIPAVESKFLDFMENHFEKLFKQVGGQNESDSKFPDCRDDLPTQEQIPVCAVREHQSAVPDNENQQSVSDEGKSTQRPDQVGTHSPTAEQPISPNSSGQDQAESVPNRNHRHFSHGSAKMLTGKNDLPEHANEEPNTTRTTAHVPFSSLKKTYKFARICANLCWFMRVQNPPMVIDITLKEGDEINFDFYKNYTQKGKRVGYFVWPALFLHKDGPLLCKGIVQPLSTKKD
ncbi:uncharacterized protein LOC117329388 isoform X2 [Pecten maximus]|uniref:uncharacterized protein LOC117329388 isoform X2 n=1 Tax=Pecten maximus TaxID=6579 RepID=UPI0014580452|nr:uncharacterized protein LOC117329388 isoform X2 [Pecten maximus]